MGKITDFLKVVGGEILDEASKELARRRKSKDPSVQNEATFINDQGVKALNNGNFAKALECFKTAVEMGHSTAMMNLGYMYEIGSGVIKNSREAFNWYLKSASYDNVNAMAVVADKYTEGDGVIKDISKAFKWYLKAAENGNINSMVSVAILYATYIQEDNNEATAIDWMTKAIVVADEQGDSESLNVCVLRMRELGDIFLSQYNEICLVAKKEGIILGDLGDKDPSRNLYAAYLECYERAAKCGDEIAQQTLHKISNSIF